MKRIFCIAFISIVCCFSFLTGYCSLYSVPVFGAQDQWEDLTSDDQLVDAFKVYCKSRNLAIEGSVLDAVTSFTTKTFNSICNTLGIDVTQLQAEIQRTYSGSGYKYAFSALGLSGFNRIFAEFLQNNDLAVGDSANETDNTLFDGEYFKYQDYSCFIWVSDNSNDANSSDQSFPSRYILKRGTFIDSGFTIKTLYDSGTRSIFYPFVNRSYPLTKPRQAYCVDGWGLYGTMSSGYPVDGGVTIFRYQGRYWLTVYRKHGPSNNLKESTFFLDYLSDNSVSDITNANIYITTNNNTINNETVINEGDTIIYNDDGTPDTGGGGDQGDDWNPVLPDIPSAGSDPSGGNTINWPDLDLPDFGSSNFSLGDLRLKFPFSIPFDIVSILGVINAPPVAPVIQEDIPIRIDLMNVDYTIPINLDMSDSLYDNFAVLVRAVEFIGFCIGLIHLTIRLVKG